MKIIRRKISLRIPRGNTSFFSGSLLHFLLLVIFYASIFAHKVNRLKSDVNTAVTFTLSTLLYFTSFCMHWTSRIFWMKSLRNVSDYRFNGITETRFSSHIDWLMWDFKILNKSAEIIKKAEITFTLIFNGELRCAVVFC